MYLNSQLSIVLLNLDIQAAIFNTYVLKMTTHAVY